MRMFSHRFEPLVCGHLSIICLSNVRWFDLLQLLDGKIYLLILALYEVNFTNCNAISTVITHMRGDIVMVRRVYLYPGYN
jgi:hypothetical protein